MPALLASSPNCREGSVVTIRIGTSGYRFDSRRAASRPFISGIKKSITVTSGALSRHVSTALRPLAASPTTTHSATCSSTARRLALILALSSTRKIRIKQVLPARVCGSGPLIRLNYRLDPPLAIPRRPYAGHNRRMAHGITRQGAGRAFSQ